MGVAEPGVDRNADPVLELALRIHDSVRAARPDAWRGVHRREQVIRAALFNVLQDADDVERLFLVIKQHGEY